MERLRRSRRARQRLGARAVVLLRAERTHATDDSSEDDSEAFVMR